MYRLFTLKQISYVAISWHNLTRLSRLEACVAVAQVLEGSVVLCYMSAFPAVPPFLDFFYATLHVLSAALDAVYA